MLDPGLCPRTHSRWVAFTSIISHTFTKAIPLSVRIAAVCLLILGFIYLVWQLRQPKHKQKIGRKFWWHRRLTRFVIVLTVITVLVTSPPGLALATQVLTNIVPMTSDSTADAIVILGRGPKLQSDRVEVAAALWRMKRATKIFVSGRGDAKRIIEQLQQQDVPEQVLSGEGCSMTTAENAKFTAELLQPQGMQKILLVTDAPHMLRSLLTFRSFGFEVYPFATLIPPNLGYRERAVIVFREYGGLIAYVLRGRFFSSDFTTSHQVQQRHSDGNTAGDLL